MALLFILLFWDSHFLGAMSYMTLFNGTGNWVFAVLGEPGAESTMYRVCKNSQDRQKNQSSSGSLAFICLTVKPAEHKASLGIWHSSDVGKPGDMIPCAIGEDEMPPVWGSCLLEPANFANYDVLITEDDNEIRRLFGRQQISVLLKGGEADGKPLVFRMDVSALKEAVTPAMEVFEPWLPE